MNRKTIAFLVSALVVLVLDQVSKLWVVSKIVYADRIQIIPGVFDITHVRNGGGAFSFFADGPSEQRMVFFIGTTIVAIVLLVAFFLKLRAEEAFSATALGTVLGGALGNLSDRLRLGEVVDFLDVHLLGGYTWPTFNLADSAIVIGVTLLVLEVFLERDEPADHANRPESVEPAQSR